MNTMHAKQERRLETLTPVEILAGLSQSAAQTAHVPVMMHVLLDASSSVSEPDFRKANHIIAEFAKVLYVLSQEHPGERADWLSVNWFGGVERSQDYQGTRWINCSEIADMALLYNILEHMPHPKYKHTGLFSAVALATVEMMEMDQTLPGPYFKTIFVITDGADNDSSDDVTTLIRQSYQNDVVTLFVIGVGNNAKIGELQDVAELVMSLDDFGDLLGMLIGAREMFSALA